MKLTNGVHQGDADQIAKILREYRDDPPTMLAILTEALEQLVGQERSKHMVSNVNIKLRCSICEGRGYIYGQGDTHPCPNGCL